MADVVRFSLSFRSLCFSSSLITTNVNSLPPLNNCNSNCYSYKKIYPLIYSSSASVPRFSSTPRKQLLSFKVHATVAETDQPKWWEKNAGPNMIDIHSTQEFLGALSQAGDRLVIVEFYGTWCASCRALFPKEAVTGYIENARSDDDGFSIWAGWEKVLRSENLSKLEKLCRTAEEHPEILFLKVNFDENKPMCKSLNVKVLPYFHFYRGAHGQLESFSCSLAKFQKIKDAIALHNTTQSSGGPPKGIGELTLESVSSPTEKPAGSA